MPVWNIIYTFKVGRAFYFQTVKFVFTWVSNSVSYYGDNALTKSKSVYLSNKNRKQQLKTKIVQYRTCMILYVT